MPKLSPARVLRLLLVWLGVPLGPGLAAMLPPDKTAQALLWAWFFAGIAMLLANASGIVTVRARRRVPVEGDD